MDDFAECVLQKIRQWKEARPGGGAAVPVSRTPGPPALLEPVTWEDVGRPDAVALLAQWRLAAADSFPTQFPVTLAGTRDWLVGQVLRVPDRLLFWVTDDQAARYGHLGLFR